MTMPLFNLQAARKASGDHAQRRTGDLRAAAWEQGRKDRRLKVESRAEELMARLGEPR